MVSEPLGHTVGNEDQPTDLPEGDDLIQETVGHTTGNEDQPTDLH